MLRADAPNPDHVGPVGMLQLVDKSDPLVAAKFTVFVILKVEPFVFLEVRAAQPIPIQSGAASGVLEQARHNHDTSGGKFGIATLSAALGTPLSLAT